MINGSIENWLTEVENATRPGSAISKAVSSEMKQLNKENLRLAGFLRNADSQNKHWESCMIVVRDNMLQTVKEINANLKAYEDG